MSDEMRMSELISCFLVVTVHRKTNHMHALIRKIILYDVTTVENNRKIIEKRENNHSFQIAKTVVTITKSELLAHF